MPRIPDLNEGQRIQPRNPVSAVSTEQGAIQGRAISSLGGGLANLGTALQQVEKKKKDIKSKLLMEQGRQRVRANAIQASARAEVESNEDGSNQIDLYNKYLDEANNKVFKDYDGIVLDDIKNSGLKFKNDFLGQTYNRSLQKAGQYFKNLAEDNLNNSINFARTNPLQAIGEAEAFGNSIRDLAGKNTGFIPPGEATKLIENGSKDIHLAAIRGLIDAGKEDVAQTYFSRKEVSKFFDSKQQDQIINTIQDAKFNRLNDKFKLLNVQNNLNQLEIEKRSQQTVEELSTKLAQSNNVFEISKIRKAIDDEIGGNRLTSQGRVLLKGQTKESLKELDDRADVTLAQQFSDSSIKPASMRKDIINMISAGKITNEGASKWFIRIRNVENARKKFTPESLNAGKALLDSKFGQPSPFDFMNKPDIVKRKNLARFRFFDLIDRGNLSPVEAAKKTITEFLPGIEGAPAAKTIPIEDQSDVNSLKKATIQLRSRLESGQFGDPSSNEAQNAYIKELNIVEDRIKAFEVDEMRKNIQEGVPSFEEFLDPFGKADQPLLVPFRR